MRNWYYWYVVDVDVVVVGGADVEGVPWLFGDMERDGQTELARIDRPTASQK